MSEQPRTINYNRDDQDGDAIARLPKTASGAPARNWRLSEICGPDITVTGRTASNVFVFCGCGTSREEVAHKLIQAGHRVVLSNTNPNVVMVSLPRGRFATGTQSQAPRTFNEHRGRGDR